MDKQHPGSARRWLDCLRWSADGLLLVAALTVPTVALARLLRIRLALPLP